ncbi:hypothetical protein J7L70_01420 [Candidatus Bathyarchaeota archaeon]|nr:hypothetical protein [Candidatus Bathyarchaeota archaeon]
MSTPVLSRDASVELDGSTVGYCRGVRVGIDVELVKEYRLGSDKPAVLEAGNKSFTVDIDYMWLDSSVADKVLSGTKVAITVYPEGNASGKPKITLSNVVLTGWEFRVEQDGVILETVSGEAEDIEFGTVT